MEISVNVEIFSKKIYLSKFTICHLIENSFETCSKCIEFFLFYLFVYFFFFLGGGGGGGEGVFEAIPPE